MKKSIIEIVEKGGTITIPHKSKINEWYGELKITKLSKGEYVIQPHWQKFSNIEDAVNWFLNEGFTSKNVGYTQGRLNDKGLISESELEKPTKRLKDLFKSEAKLVDEEAKEFNIVIKPFPKAEEVIEYAESMVKDTTINNIVDSLTKFEEKYMTLNPYISLGFIYDTNDSSEFSSSIDYKSFSEKTYNKYKNIDDNCRYKNMQITIKIEGEDKYLRYKLNF